MINFDKQLKSQSTCCIEAEDSLRIGRIVEGPSSVAATLSEHSPGQERLKSITGIEGE